MERPIFVVRGLDSRGISPKSLSDSDIHLASIFPAPLFKQLVETKRAIGICSAKHDHSSAPPMMKNKKKKGMHCHCHKFQRNAPIHNASPLLQQEPIGIMGALFLQRDFEDSPSRLQFKKELSQANDAFLHQLK